MQAGKKQVCNKANYGRNPSILRFLQRFGKSHNMHEATVVEYQILTWFFISDFIDHVSFVR